jgi:uncharacterized protein (DUF433 family)
MCHHHYMREDDLIAYPQDRAAAVAGVSQRVVRYWDRTGLIQPQVRRRLSPRNVVRLYNFQDMLSLLVAAELRRRRFSLQRVRKAVAHLRSRGYQEPLTELRFATAGKEIYFQHADGEWEGDLSRDQLIFHSVIDLDMIRAKIREGVQRPASAHGKVEKRRGSLGNKPVFAGTRIPVATVTGWLAEGFSDDQIIEEYPDLTPADLRAARALRTSA